MLALRFVLPCFWPLPMGNDRLIPIRTSRARRAGESTCSAGRYGFGGTGKWAAIPILLASFAVFRALNLVLLQFVSFLSGADAVGAATSHA